MQSAVSLSSMQVSPFGECFFFFFFFFFFYPIDIECASIELRASHTECSENTFCHCSRSNPVKCGELLHCEYRRNMADKCLPYSTYNRLPGNTCACRQRDHANYPGHFRWQCKIIHVHPWPMRRAIWTAEASSAPPPPPYISESEPADWMAGLLVRVLPLALCCVCIRESAVLIVLSV